MLSSEQMSQLIKECEFSFALAGGKGGQNVNKVETKVILTFNLFASDVLTERQKVLIQQGLKNKLNQYGEIKLSNAESRSQLKNKQQVIQIFLNLINESLKEKKKRFKTKVPMQAKRRRLKNKKQRSEIKDRRRRPNKED